VNDSYENEYMSKSINFNYNLFSESYPYLKSIMATQTGMIMPKVNFASTMIVEDHLKKMLSTTQARPFKVTGGKLLPKAQHSAFGDFPPEYLPGKKNNVTQVEPIDKHELSIAAKGVRKSIIMNYINSFSNS
jgi:hypothetical protein